MVWIDNSLPASATEAETCRGKSGRAKPQQHYWSGVTYLSGGVYLGHCSRCSKPVTSKKGSKSLVRVVPEDQINEIALKIGRRMMMVDK